MNFIHNFKIKTNKNNKNNNKHSDNENKSNLLGKGWSMMVIDYIY